MFSWERDDFDENGKLILLYRHQRIIDEKLINKNDKILDIGGWGKLSYRLYQEECNVILLNIDKKECISIKNKYPNTFTIILSDAREIPFKNDTFNKVTCFETLEHITINREKAIKEIFRVLKPNGILIGTIPIPGMCHALNDNTIKFCYPDELQTLINQYTQKIHIEKTASINKNDTESSWYFYTIKKL